MMTYAEIMQQIPKQMKYVDDIDRVALLNRILKQLGQPQANYPLMHICGTNGKGSTGVLVRDFLVANQKRVGHFSSPPMYDDLEQIAINGKSMSENEFVEVYQKLLEALQALNLTQADITIFETFVLIAAVYFAEQAVDFSVFECGLGGALDATNALGMSDYTIFTKIDLDHMQVLGSTLSEIATNKAQIIDPNSIVFNYPDQDTQVTDILKQEAAQKQVAFIDKTPYRITRVKTRDGHLYVDVQLADGLYSNQPFGLLGAYQVENLQNALNWLYIYNQQHQNQPIADTLILQVIKQVSLPGRMQQVHQNPDIYIDGAHNENAIAGLVATLGTQQRYDVIVGFLKDKDYADCVALLGQLNAHFILTEPIQPERALSYIDLAQTFKAEGITDFSVADDLTDALRQVQGTKNPIIVTGSFYLINHVVPLIQQEELF